MAEIKNRIKDLGIKKRYGCGRSLNYELFLPELLEIVENESDTVVLKEVVLGIAQLYADGLIDKKFDAEEWEEQKGILKKLNYTGIQTMGQFYSGQGIDPEMVRDGLLFDQYLIKTYAADSDMKSRHLSGGEGDVLRAALDYQMNERIIGSIDSIVATTSGGLEPAYLLAYILGNDEIAGIRYSPYGSEDNTARIPREAPRDYLDKFCMGKNVAVVEDVVCTGVSMQEAIELVLKSSPKRVIGVVSSGTGETAYGKNSFSKVREKVHREMYPTIFELKPNGDRK